LATDRQTDRQTDEQTDSIDALSRSRCRERRLNNCLLRISQTQTFKHLLILFSKKELHNDVFNFVCFWAAQFLILDCTNCILDCTNRLDCTLRI